MVSSVSTSVTVAACSSRIASRPERRIACRPPPSGANQRMPGDHRGPPSSSVHGARLRLVPSSPMRKRFHQPSGSVRASRESADSHSTWQTLSRGPPASTRCGPSSPSGRDAQLGAVPRHARVVPADPGDPAAVGAQPGPGHEPVARGEHAGLAAVERHGHQVALDVGGPVADDRLADAQHRGAVRAGGEVGVAQAVVARGLGADRPRLGGRADLDRVQPLVGPVGEHEQLAVRAAEHRPGPAAVLVQPVADVPRRGQDLDRRRPVPRGPARSGRPRSVSSRPTRHGRRARRPTWAPRRPKRPKQR